MVLKLLLIGVAVIFCGCSTTNHSREPDHPIAAGCSIFNSSGQEIWNYPAQFCRFFPDGRFISGGSKGLTLHAADRSAIWHKDLVPMMLSQAKNGDLLIVTAEWEAIEKKNPPFKRVKTYRNAGAWTPPSEIPKEIRKQEFRSDRILRVNLEGQVLAERNLLHGEDYVVEDLINWGAAGKPANFKTPYTGTFFNSIYEIPANSSPLPALKAGNILINDEQNSSLVILDKELKKIAWQLPTDKLGFASVLDVQILSNGHLLLLKNFSCDWGAESSLEEIDPVSLLPVWQYSGAEFKGFRAKWRGGVQSLAGGRHLFGYGENDKFWVKLIDAEDKVTWEMGIPTKFAEAHSLPVESFLRYTISR